MTRDRLPVPLLVVLVCLSLAVLAARCAPPVEAQGRDAALDLARLAVHEAGWEHPADAAAIYAVAVYGGERTGMEWHRWLGVHSRRFASGHVARSWVYRLDRAGTDPRAGIRWESYRARWLAVLAAADAAIGAEPVCVARTWGSADDYARRRALGIVDRIVDCGPTRGIYSARGQR